jgi:GLPGLI family protein
MIKPIFIKHIIFFISLIAGVHDSRAQQFISKAAIEFEVKTNLKKTLGDNSWAERMSENLPTFKTGYYQFSFSGTKSLYKFDHWDEKEKIPDFLRKSDEENQWYFDHSSNQFQMQKNVFGTNFNVTDSIMKIQWKLSNENRVIAGYNCRKATGIIMDSVYVFAFYTEEIMISGGPCSINGLPGMILGLTIPRMYTSFIATKVTIDAAKEADIKATTGKNMLNKKQLQSTLTERTKEWFSGDDPESKKWIDQFLWGTLL